MPSGSFTLLEGQKYGDNLLKSGVVETLVQESPILEQLPFMTVEGNAVEVTLEGDLPSPQYRNVNEGYTRSWGSDTKRFFGVAILGGEVFIDNYILRVQANRESVKARQWAKYAKSLSRQFDLSFFDGTGAVATKDFKGVNALIDEGLGQQHVAGASGATLTLAMLDTAMDLLRTKSADAILINRDHRRKITDLARSTYSGYSLIDIGSDVFGRKVNTYNGLPMRIIGDDANGNAILGFDETQGGSGITSSLYIIDYGVDDGVAGLSGAGGTMEVRDFGETEAAPGHLGRVEWYPGLAVFNAYSVVRLRGILA